MCRFSASAFLISVLAYLRGCIRKEAELLAGLEARSKYKVRNANCLRIAPYRDTLQAELDGEI